MKSKKLWWLFLGFCLVLAYFLTRPPESGNGLEVGDGWAILDEGKQMTLVAPLANFFYEYSIENHGDQVRIKGPFSTKELPFEAETCLDLPVSGYEVQACKEQDNRIKVAWSIGAFITK